MTVATNQRVPELVAGVDVRVLPLSALEGFVLSRIDGRSNTGDIVSLTGLGLDQVMAILDKLTALGAVQFRDAPAQSVSGTSARRTESVGARAEGTGTGVHGAPPRRRHPSHSPPSHHRRVFSESGVSSPPPEMPQSSRPRSPSEPSLPPSRAGSNRPPPGSSPPPGDHGQGRGGSARRGEPAHEARPAQAQHAVVAPAMPPSPLASIAPSTVPEGVLYDPRELDEDVDLPIERRKQVLDLFYRLAELDHYEVLGVPYQADKKEIRAAYFSLSKAFHPDSMFRKNLGSFKAKMVAVFQLLTEAYETLSKKKARDEYDAYLRTTKAARMAERALHFSIAAEQPMQVPPAPMVPTIPEPRTQSSEPSPAPAAPLPPPKEASPEARRLAQEVIGRRLRGVMPGPPRPATPASVVAAPPTAVPAAPAPPAATSAPAATGAPASPAAAASAGSSAFAEGPKTDTRELLRRLTSTLRDAGQITGSNDGVTRALRASQAALERGDLSEATQQAARAASLAPERPELRAQHGKLSAQLSEKLANTYIEQARFEMKHGKWASAALTWTKVCEGRPTDAAAHRSAAHALLKAGGDLRGAQKYAQKAVLLAPSDIEARVLLAQICLTVGLKLNARRELEAAAKLDPANEMVKNLLADLEKG